MSDPFFRFGGFFGGMVWMEVLPTFSAQNKFVIWSASAEKEKWRCSGWLVGMTIHLGCSMTVFQVKEIKMRQTLQGFLSCCKPRQWPIAAPS